MLLNGKVAIITGASAGIGAACAAELDRCGVRLSLTARSEEGLRKAAPHALITAGDLTSERTRRAVLERTLERYGSVDILINNAGAGCYIPSWRAPVEEARRLMELNYFALLGMSQLVAPHMRDRGSGVIVNISSIGGKVTLPWSTLYSATKYAVNALTEGMRVELRRDGVRTMLVCPGYVHTGFQAASSGQVPEGVVRARRFAISPEACATAIRRGLERDARTVVTPRAGWLLVALSRIFPALLEARMARLNGTA
ncbi:MAG TPA: SDR family NAD(P)-dependent oxidoreductase [Bryobacteraceae bacterium]|nr:SDR family NAD(P)-dependent oxidoreductase [Bryobacteraceae bacterium]